MPEPVFIGDSSSSESTGLALALDFSMDVVSGIKFHLTSLALLSTCGSVSQAHFILLAQHFS